MKITFQNHRARWISGICTTVVCILVFSAAEARADGTTTANLLLNPSAETGDLTGWTKGGSSNPFVDNGTWETDVPLLPLSGSYDFAGGSGASGFLSQTISLLNVPGITFEAIDSGDVIAHISFWEQSLDQPPKSDAAYVSLTFYDDSLSQIGTYAAPELASGGLWEQHDASIDVPENTRSIKYTMSFVRFSGTDLDAFIDDNSLTLTVPEPSVWAMLTTGAGALAFYGHRRSRRSSLRTP